MQSSLNLNKYRNIDPIKLEKIITYGIISFLILLPASHILLINTSICWAVQVALVTTLGLFCFFLLVLKLVNVNTEFHVTKADICICLLTLFGVISVIFSVDRYNSFYGAPNRNEGIRTLVAYYLIFLLCTFISSSANKKKILYAFIVNGLVQSIFGYLQAYRVINMATATLTAYDGRAVGFVQHFNYFGTITTLLLGITVGFYIFSEVKKIRIASLILSALFFGALLCSTTRSSIVGAIMILLLIIAIEIIKYVKFKHTKEIRNHSARIAIALVVFSMVFTAINLTTDIITDRVSGTKLELSQGVTDNDVGSGRMYIWKRGLFNLKEYWLTGVGIDNFSYALNNPNLPPVDEKYNVSKAHNEYLQTLVTQGVFGVITYIGLLLLIFFNGLKQCLSPKKSDRNSFVYFALLLAFFGYISQAFFNSSIVNVAPYFWIICGMLCGREDRANLIIDRKRLKK